MTASPPLWSKRSLAAQAMGMWTRHQGDRAADPCGDHLHPRRGQRLFLGFVYGRPDNATVRRRGGSRHAGGRRRGALLVLVRHGGGHRRVPGASDPGDHIVASKVMYWALRHWLMTEAARWGLAVDFVETDEPDALRGASSRAAPGWAGSRPRPTRSGPSPTSPPPPDIAHAAGARLAVDSTPPRRSTPGRWRWRRHRDACGHQGARTAIPTVVAGVLAGARPMRIGTSS
jgi:cystathionine gamma-synthase